MIRIFDIIIAISGLLIAIPLLLVLILIGYVDTGSPIFVQNRLGKDQKVFKLLKLRSMSTNTPSKATHLTDPRSITRYGQFLRNTKLDEIPQLLNVINGDMSLVGPRPGLVNQSEVIAERSVRNVFDVRPGITGLAQISGVDMATPKKLAELDAKMIEGMSVRKYMFYLVSTLIGKGHKVSK